MDVEKNWEDAMQNENNPQQVGLKDAVAMILDVTRGSLSAASAGTVDAAASLRAAMEEYQRLFCPPVKRPRTEEEKRLYGELAEDAIRRLKQGEDYAAIELGEMGHPYAAHFLIRIMLDKEKSWRVTAAETLGTMKDAAAAEALFMVPRDKGDSSSMRLAALISLAQIVAFLFGCLSSENEKVAKAAKIGLGRILDAKRAGCDIGEIRHPCR